jgi:hypothetical protein
MKPLSYVKPNFYFFIEFFCASYVCVEKIINLKYMKKVMENSLPVS